MVLTNPVTRDDKVLICLVLCGVSTTAIEKSRVLLLSYLFYLVMVEGCLERGTCYHGPGLKEEGEGEFYLSSPLFLLLVLFLSTLFTCYLAKALTV